MREIKRMERESLNTLIKEHKQTFDIVRIVEPKENSVVFFGDSGIQKETLTPCFSVWNKSERCDNCISQRACHEHRRLSKFEFRDDEVYNVIAVPILVQDGTKEQLVSLELVNNITNDLIVQADGNTPSIEEIKRIVRIIYEDSLTGTFNRRYYDEKQYLYEMTNAVPSMMGFLMVSINDFKQVNDSFGYQAGDKLLIMAASIMKNSVRSTDKVIRIGGVDFLIVIKECSYSAARKKLKEIKHAVESLYMEDLGLYRPAVSVGMGYTDSFDGTEKMLRELFSEADMQLHHDKNGRSTRNNKEVTNVIQDQQSLKRMNQALKDTVNVYTDIEVDSMTYRQINMNYEEYFSVDAEGDYEPAFEHMCRDEIHADDVPSVRKNLAPAVIKRLIDDKHGPKELRVRYCLKNASPVVMMESRAIFMRDEKPRHVIVVTSDITETITLEEQNMAFSNILNHIAIGIYVLKFKDDVIDLISINSALNTMLERNIIPEENVSLMELFRHVHSEDLPEVLQTLNRLKQPGGTAECEYRTQKSKNNEYCWILSKGKSVLQSDGAVMVYICMYDTTEMKKLSEMEEALRVEKAAQENKFSFMSNMSHEIRTPMNAIMGMASLAADIAPANSEIVNYINKINESSEYLLGIINDILEMTRIEKGKTELNYTWTELNNIFVPVCDMIIPMMEKKSISFEYDKTVTESDNVEVYLDIQKTRQLLMNILNNACKFTDRGGHVQMNVRKLPLQKQADKLVYQIVIEDNGCGMSREFLSKIFTPFEQERLAGMASVQGTGLGMAISHNTVQAMGGEIKVESELHKGSKFIVTLPMCFRRVDHKAAHLAVIAPVKSGTLTDKRILLAEDHPLNAEIAQKLLEKRGMLVMHASNGEQAVKLFNGNPAGFFDAILMDVRMPIMDGICAARIIRQSEHADAQLIPIIAMTANAYEEDRRETAAAGMNAHLAKPIKTEEMYQCLEKLIK